MLQREMLELVFARMGRPDLHILRCTSRDFRVLASQRLARMVVDELCREFREELQPDRKPFPKLSVELRDCRVKIWVSISRARDDLICINADTRYMEHFSDHFVYRGHSLPTDLCAYVRKACQDTGDTHSPAWRSRTFKILASLPY